ncbi:type II secretion system F family protein [Stieleria sp. JC731]|uniref:type II secretion system F family protein n=1 Tax=Pirellulaceae TaxID=2691357 RepID=UPI001E514F56|nr:type II secretion system F family protein [Stieleria sp. JC731]MCC9601496.1 type II secretion system F family protein [Stieleria sp. JC731]
MKVFAHPSDHSPADGSNLVRTGDVEPYDDKSAFGQTSRRLPTPIEKSNAAPFGHRSGVHSRGTTRAGLNRAGHNRAGAHVAAALQQGERGHAQIHLTKVSSSSVLMSLNQLAVMTQNGIEIAEAVQHVSRNCKDDRLGTSLNAIYESVHSGSTFSAAVATHGIYFPKALPAVLAAAESTGEVPQALSGICERMRGELEIRASILGALIYPLILIAAAMVVMAALVLGVLPQFGKVFDSLGKPVPPSTQVLLDLGKLGRQHWMLGFGGFAGATVAITAMRRHLLVRKAFGYLLLYAPFIRDAYRPLSAGRVFRTIAAMVGGGVPLLQAVRLTRNTVVLPAWKDLLSQMESNLIDGLSASEALFRADFLPPEAAQMMATGERTGRVAEVLEDIGQFYETEGGRKTKRLVIALEPTIILAMGIVVAGVVMSVMLPLLEVSTVQSY